MFEVRSIPRFRVIIDLACIMPVMPEWTLKCYQNWIGLFDAFFFNEAI